MAAQTANAEEKVADANIDNSEQDAEGSTSQCEGESSEDSVVEPGPSESGVHGTSAAQTVFNIVKNIVGEGMLSMPAGLAAGTGLVVGCLICAAFGTAMAYSFSMMARVCEATGTTNHKDCAKAVWGPKLAELMAGVCMVKTGFTCVSYAMVIGESISHILHFFGAEGVYTRREVVLVIVVVAVLLPLCMQKDLSVLAYTSLFGIVCEVCVVAFMQVRLSDGSYLPGGRFYGSTLPENRPYFGEPDSPHYYEITASTFVLLGSLSTAFIAHYNAPKFYAQMRSRTVRHFNLAVAIAFSVALGIYLWVMSVGYLTFGAHCRGLILNNYSEHDEGATAARVAIGVAVVFGFPLSFTALRDSTMSVFDLPRERSVTFASVTLALLVGITVLGCGLDDLGLVNSLGGAVLGASITLLFPGALCYLTMRGLRKGSIPGSAKAFWAPERGLSLAAISMGFILIVFGSSIVLLKKFSPEVLVR